MAAHRATVQRLDDVDLTFNGRFHIHRELNRASRFVVGCVAPGALGCARTQQLTACAGGATAVVFEAMDMKHSRLVALKARAAAASARARRMRASLPPRLAPARATAQLRTALFCGRYARRRVGWAAYGCAVAVTVACAAVARVGPHARRCAFSVADPLAGAPQVLNNNLHASEHTGMEVSLEAAEREVASARQLKHPNSALPAALASLALRIRCAALRCASLPRFSCAVLTAARPPVAQSCSCWRCFTRARTRSAL